MSTINRASLEYFFATILIPVALIIYGVWSNPFPVSYRLPELIIGIILILVSLKGFIQIFSGWVYVQGKAEISHISFLLLLGIPLLIGVFTNELADIVRDIVPLFYLFIPLLLLNWYDDERIIRFVMKCYPFVFSIVGLCFSIKYFVSTGIRLSDLSESNFHTMDMTYSVYDPTVLFMTIFSLLTSINLIHEKKKIFIRKIFSILFLAFSLVGLGAIASVVQRGQIGLIVLSLALYMSRIIKKSKLVAVINLCIVLGTIFLLFNDQLSAMIRLFFIKTNEVGLNNKDLEMALILNEISGNLSSAIFGNGWGATFFDPAGGGVVRFTHNMFSFVLLKAGLFGELFFIIYFLKLLIIFIKIYKDNYKDINLLPVLLATGSSIVIGFLQPTFKTLSFGFILLLLPIIKLYLFTESKKETTSTKKGF